ncbi:MAG: hypothetical protein ACXVFN_04000 [Solirubrobacteraceae bacterium]
MRALDDRPRLPAAVTLVLALVVLALAWGHDAASSARAAVGNATGPLIADSLGGGAVLSARNMSPNSVQVGEVTVSNAGDTAGDMTLAVSDVANVAARGTPLSSVLDLTVVDVTAGRAPALVYSGKLDGLHSVALGTFEQGDAHRYRFLVSFPGGPDDDLYQGASTTVSFVWTAAQVAPRGSGGSDQGAGTTPAPAAPAPGPGPSPSPPIESHVAQSQSPGYLKLRVYVRRTQAAHRRRVYVNVFCNHRCTLTATGVVSLPSQKRTWRMRPLKGTVKARGTVKYRMALPAKALARLDQALLHRKRASVKLRIAARSGTQTQRWTRTIHLAR